MADRVYTLNGKRGVWRTIGGRRVFISDGDDLPTAMKKSGKFERIQKDKKRYREMDEKARKEIEATHKTYDEEFTEARRLGRDDLEKAARDKRDKRLKDLGEIRQDIKKSYEERISGKEYIEDYPEAYRHYERDYESTQWMNDNTGLREEFGLSRQDYPKEQDYLPGGKKWNKEWENSREAKLSNDNLSNIRRNVNLDRAKRDYDEEPSEFMEIAKQYGLKGKDYEAFDNYAKSKNPLESMANDRIREKQNTLNNDRILLDGMRKRGMNEIAGSSRKDIERNINKNAKYLGTADSDIPEWLEVGNKSVQDSDGFTTDYTLYLNTKNGKMSTVFGDKDLYNVDTGTDMDFDTPEEAWDWFNNYKGFEEAQEDDLMERAWQHHLKEAKERGITPEELSKIKTREGLKRDGMLVPIDPYKPEDEAKRIVGSKKKPSYWDSIKAGKVDTAGKSNRKEVSANIQAHIKDYYDSPEDFVNQMEAMKDNQHPTAWSWGQEYARGGGYLIYNSDMEDFLNTLNINPKGKKFNDEQVFNNYTALIGRESAKMYDNIRKDAVKTLSERYSGTIDYLKQTENMSTSEILELLKRMDK